MAASHLAHCVLQRGWQCESLLHQPGRRQVPGEGSRDASRFCGTGSLAVKNLAISFVCIFSVTSVISGRGPPHALQLPGDGWDLFTSTSNNKSLIRIVITSFLLLPVRHLLLLAKESTCSPLRVGVFSPGPRRGSSASWRKPTRPRRSGCGSGDACGR